MTSPEVAQIRGDLLAALEALEEAVSIDYGMQADPRPATAAALRRARDVIRRTRVRPRPPRALRIVAG